LKASLELAEQADEDGSVTEILFIAAAVGLFLGNDRAVHDLHRRMVARARERGALGLLGWALPRLAVSDIWAGQWASANARLAEALELARNMDQHVLVAFLLSEQAIVTALRGNDEACRALAAGALDEASARQIPYVGFIANSALVALELGLGRSDVALERSRAYDVMPGLDFWDAPDRIEAAVRAGAPDTAQQVLDPFGRWAEAAGSAWARPVALHGRALLTADAQGAEELFKAALKLHAQAHRPLERARAELAFGEFLRRARRRTEARGHLKAALATFEALGARLWADRARVELRAQRAERPPARPQHDRPAHRPGAADRAPCRGGPDQPRHRHAVLPQPAHDRLPPAQHLPQARRELPPRARPADPQLTAGARPVR
jgi:hypothetical protein